MGRSLSAVLLTVLFLLGCAVPVAAQRQVSRDRRSPRLTSYHRAARQAGVGHWYAVPGATARAYLRLDGDEAVLTLELPPASDPAPTVAWWRAVIARTGWTDADLSYRDDPGALYLRADTASVFLGGAGGRRRAWVDLEPLRAEVEQRTGLPMVLAVRVVGGPVGAVIPPPQARTRAPDHFLFYRLAPSLSRLTVIYPVISARRLWAWVTAFALWTVFPPLALAVCRRHVRRTARATAEERVIRFRTWMGAVLAATGTGSVATLVLMLVLAPGPPLVPGRGWFFLGMFGPLVLGLAAGAVLAAPLEREAFPERAKLPWHRRMSGLWAVPTVAAIVIGLFLIGQLPTWGRGWGWGPLWAVAGAGVAILVLVASGSVVWLLFRQRHRVSGGALSEPEAPAEVTGAVREFAAQLGIPVRRVLVGRMATPLAAPGDDVVLVSEMALDEFRPEELAALATSLLLLTPRTRRDRLLFLLPAAPLLLIPIGLGIAVFAAVTGNPGLLRSFMPLLVVLLPAAFVPGLLVTRKIQRRQEEADLWVADAFGEPARFLDAVRRMERLSLRAIAVPNAGPMAAAQSMRSRRLADRLGLE